MTGLTMLWQFTLIGNIMNVPVAAPAERHTPTHRSGFFCRT